MSPLVEPPFEVIPARAGLPRFRLDREGCSVAADIHSYRRAELWHQLTQTPPCRHAHPPRTPGYDGPEGTEWPGGKAQ